MKRLLIFARDGRSHQRFVPRRVAGATRCDRHVRGGRVSAASVPSPRSGCSRNLTALSAMMVRMAMQSTHSPRTADKTEAATRTQIKSDLNWRRSVRDQSVCCTVCKMFGSSALFRSATSATDKPVLRDRTVAGVSSLASVCQLSARWPLIGAQEQHPIQAIRSLAAQCGENW